MDLDLLSFLSYLFLAFSILQIILFFKIWGMTNDVNKLKQRFVDPFYSVTAIKHKILLKEYEEAYRMICSTLVNNYNNGDYDDNQTLIIMTKEINRELPDFLQSSDAYWKSYSALGNPPKKIKQEDSGSKGFFEG